MSVAPEALGVGAPHSAVFQRAQARGRTQRHGDSWIDSIVLVIAIPAFPKHTGNAG